LRRDLADKVRIDGVTDLQQAIALAARAGSLTTSSSSSSSARQMEINSGNDASLDERIERIERAVLNAMRTQQGTAATPSGLGAKTQTRRGYAQERGGRNGSRDGPGGRAGVQGEFRGTVPGVPAEVAQQRWNAGQCLRCGSTEHRSRGCPNATSATPHSSN
jgi:hypothetical protein